MTMKSIGFSRNSLKMDAVVAVKKIEDAIRDQIFRQSKRKGAVIGLSGGIDSSVTTVLCARALGKERVLSLLLPEKESSDESLTLGKLLADRFQVKYAVENIAPLLSAAGCYNRRDEAIRSQIPEYGPGYKSKIVLASVSEGKGYNYFHIVVESPSGEQKKIRLDVSSYLGIVAATNMKQRARKFFEYYHADRLNYAVAGTPNRLEYELGFFVKNGDGASDFKPIAHLYKTQVYQLAEYLEIPEEIRSRMPTTDTYTLPQTQEEFYYSLPYHEMDLCLYAKNNGISPGDVGRVLGMPTDRIEFVYADIDRKRAASRYLHATPLLVEALNSEEAVSVGGPERS
jgi:NAD+ synthase